MPYVQTGLKDGLLTFECVEIGSAEDEQDKTDLQVGCLTMLLFMLRSLDSCLLKFSIHIVSHDFSHLTVFHQRSCFSLSTATWRRMIFPSINGR